jgi:glycyl-tRNA synthetase beta chain
VQQLDPSLAEGTRLAIADAVYDHYKPESTDDAVPRSMEGAVLSIGDKADTIAGMFSLGLVPSGSKDPFALRRQANAIVKVIAEKNLPLSLADLMRDARSGYRNSEAEKKFVDEARFTESVKAFFRERLEFYLKDICGYEYDVVKAVLAAGSDDVIDAIKRAHAVQWARSVKEFESVLIAFKRIKNILRQAREKELAIGPFERTLAVPKEIELFTTMEAEGSAFAAYCRKGDYENAIARMARLRHPLDAYFDSVLVMDPNDEIRASRLGFLDIFYNAFSTIADFSEIVAETKT